SRTAATKADSSNGTSGNRSTSGTGVAASSARPAAAVIHPAWRPITSSTNTRVDVRAIDATSNAASRIDVAMYFATEPNPGQLSVTARSLSTVFGTWIAPSG